MNNNEAALKTYSFNYTDDAEATPREIYSGMVRATDVVEAGLLAMADLGMDGTRANVYAMREMSWASAELFGMTHLMLPGTNDTVCGAKMNPNNDFPHISFIAEEISCDGCLKVARSLEIPTAN